MNIPRSTPPKPTARTCITSQAWIKKKFENEALTMSQHNRDVLWEASPPSLSKVLRCLPHSLAWSLVRAVH